MVELAPDCILITSKDIQGKVLCLMADKGEDNGKCASFVKLMTWYDLNFYRVKWTDLELRE